MPVETPSLQLISFGFKYQGPPTSNFCFDARCLINPYWQPELRPYNGCDSVIQHFFAQQASVQAYLADILALCRRWLPAFSAQHHSTLTLAIGCTGGQHRSVYLVEQLAQQLATEWPSIQRSHRDLTP